MKVVRSSPLRTSRLYPQEYPGTHFYRLSRPQGTRNCPMRRKKSPVIGDRSRDPPTTPPQAPIIHITLTNTRRCCITNIFRGLGRNDGRHSSTKYWVPGAETTKHMVHIHVWYRSEDFRAKHAVSYTGCRNLGDWCNPLQSQCTTARRLKPKRGT